MKKTGVVLMMFVCGLVLMAAQSVVQQNEAKPRMVRSIRYEGFAQITMEDVRNKFDEKGVKLKVETALDQEEVYRAKAALTELLAERGVAAPRIGVKMIVIPPNSFAITFTNETP